ncbi:MAG: helix-turn-helix domain-containing protein [Proteobacteria bacterium]|nr:helix-turn-helix domain-containing protein [Pseudomonadota bacterium]
MQYTIERLLPSEAAKLLGKAESTLARERSRGTGCAYLKVNGRVRYLKSDIDAYLAKHSQSVQPKADQ